MLHDKFSYFAYFKYILEKQQYKSISGKQGKTFIFFILSK